MLQEKHDGEVLPGGGRLESPTAVSFVKTERHRQLTVAYHPRDPDNQQRESYQHNTSKGRENSLPAKLPLSLAHAFVLYGGEHCAKDPRRGGSGRYPAARVPQENARTHIRRPLPIPSNECSASFYLFCNRRADNGYLQFAEECSKGVTDRRKTVYGCHIVTAAIRTRSRYQGSRSGHPISGTRELESSLVVCSSM